MTHRQLPGLHFTKDSYAEAKGYPPSNHTHFMVELSIIRKEQKNKKLFGGIVIPKDKQWWYNDNEKYEYNPNDLKDWKFLDLN